MGRAQMDSLSPNYCRLTMHACSSVKYGRYIILLHTVRDVQLIIPLLQRLLLNLTFATSAALASNCIRSQLVLYLEAGLFLYALVLN